MGAMQEPNFRLRLIAQAISSLGNSLVPVALAFAVLDVTGSATDLGLILGAGSAAQLVFLLIGGVVADRVSRRSLMIFADTVRGLAYLIMGISLVTGHPSLLALIALNIIVGMAAALFTPASSGLTPSLVKPENLQEANALQQTMSAAAGVTGPAVAGVFVATAGPGWAIIADALTFFAGVALIGRMRLKHVPRRQRQHWIRDLRDGWRDFWQRRWFRTLVFGAAVFNFLFAMYCVLGPVASKRYYGGVEAWAVISTIGAIGSVLGGVLATKIPERFPLRAGAPFAALAGLTPLALSVRLPVPFVAVAAVLGFAGLNIFGSLLDTNIQRHIPRDMLSRASSFEWFGSIIAFPVGLAVVGPIADSLGARPVLLGMGAVQILVMAAIAVAPSLRVLGS